MSTQLNNMFKKGKEILKNTNGQGLVEYALILVLIAIVVITAVKTLGNTTKNVFTNVNTQMSP